jgi:predicted solute-binding protein
LKTNDKPRVCAVSFLNTAPLVWGMLHGDQRELFDLSFAIPSECAARVADGRADIGIVPSIELSRQSLDIIPGAGIACHGAVRSILLVSKVPFPGIQRLAVDSSSRTSVILSRVILARKFDAHPEVFAHPPDLVTMLETADAALIIGDPALLIDPATIPFHTLDLGAEWVELTGLPMVFAVWAARAGFPTQDPAPFTDSLRFGRRHLDDILRLEQPRLGISPELAREYLTRHIVNELGPREYDGLALFLQYAKELEHQAQSRIVTA